MLSSRGKFLSIQSQLEIMPSFLFLSFALVLVVSVQARAAVDELVGYGVATTGGGSATPVTVTSCSELQSAFAIGGVIHILGTLNGCGVLDLKVGNTSIIGLGSNATITGGGIRIKRISNVIVRNIIFDTASEGDDLLGLDHATNVWVDHNEFKSIGIVGDKDYYDGLLDITHATDSVTVSWNTFSDHWKGSLLGNSDSNGAEDTGALKVTYHHNLWTSVSSRTPSVRFGTVHVYNSVYRNLRVSGINSRMGAQVLVESNIFSNVPLAVVTNLDSELEGFAVERNNIYTNSTIRITQVGSLTDAPYAYTLDDVTNLESILEASAGVGVIVPAML